MAARVTEMRARNCTTVFLLLAAFAVACSSTDDKTGSTDAAVESGSQDTGIDCSLVGCGAPPLCSTGCTETCGCCACGEGEQIPGPDGGVLVCTGGCYAEVVD